MNALYRLAGDLLHDWLPADDEANRFRIWVPTPEEITKQAEAIRAGWVDGLGRRHNREEDDLPGIRFITVTKGRFRAYD